MLECEPGAESGISGPHAVTVADKQEGVSLSMHSMSLDVLRENVLRTDVCCLPQALAVQGYFASAFGLAKLAEGWREESASKQAGMHSLLWNPPPSEYSTLPLCGIL